MVFSAPLRDGGEHEEGIFHVSQRGLRGKKCNEDQ